MLNQSESPAKTKNKPINKTAFIKKFKKLYKGKSKSEILDDFAKCYLECSEMDSLNFDLEEKLKTFNAPHIGISHNKPLLLN